MTTIPLPGLPTGPSHAPVTASLMVGAAPGARVLPVDNPPQPSARIPIRQTENIDEGHRA